MICTVCHHENDNHAKFCGQCGTSLDMRCAACSSPVRADARFCSQCGQRLEPSDALSQTPVEQAALAAGPLSLGAKLEQLQRYVPQRLAEKILANRGRLEGERKLVTVLFADLVGYTTLSEQLGEEALFAVMDEIYEAFIRDVHRYEGTVNELTGDGLVAFFGAPLAVEQAPQRAVHTALALQQTAARFRDRLAGERDLHMQLRVGINTGPVIVGSIGNNLRMDYKAVGSTVNLAARMEQTAAPGTIRISSHTYKLVQGYFDCEDLGRVSVKGVPTRVQTYQVTGAREVYGRIDVARERGFSRLVGRERELELLSHCFAMVRSGRGQAISIIGDAGLGKSRLLYEYRQALAGEYLIWLDGHCSPYGTALAYQPVVDVLKQLLDINNSDSEAVIRRKVNQGLEALNTDVATAPYLLHLLAVEVDAELPPGLSPEALKQRLFESVRTVLLACAAEYPLVVAIEDLHWIDNATEEWLTFLLDHMAASRMMLLLTYRPDFASTWSRKSYHSVITVTRLSQDDSNGLLASLLGARSIHPDLAAWVLDKAEGVPYFLEELVRSLRETNAIVWQDGQWQLTLPDTNWQIPTTVDEVLMARIDRLPEGAKRVLQMGSVIGREFSGDLIRALSGLTDQALMAHLTALSEAELIYTGGQPSRPTYVFKHAFTQEAAYRSLLSTQRCEWHRHVAEVLETLFADRLEEYYGPLAHHLMAAGEAGDADKALLYAVRAGDRNMALPAYAEAIGFYQMALEAWARQEQADEAQRYELLLTLGEAQKKAGKYAQALDTLEHAAHYAQSLGLSEALARVALEAEQVIWYGSLPAESVVRLLKVALDELPQTDSALRARVLSSSALALLWTGHLQQAAESAQQAVDIARRVGEPSARAWSLRSKLLNPWQPGETEQRLMFATEMLQLAQEIKDGELICLAHYWRLHALLEIGDTQAWDADMDTYDRLAKALQQPHFMRNTKGFQAMRALIQGHFAESEALAQQAMIIGQHMQAGDTSGTFGIQMFTIRREQGRLQELEPVVRHFVQQHGVASTWRPGLALIYSELGRQREARREFEHLAQHDFADLPRDGLWLSCMTYLAEICTFLGDAARAAMLYPLLLPYAGRCIVVGGQVACYGAASRYLGMLAATMAHWQEAAQHFEAALAMNANMGARPWLAHTQHDYAAMLMARNQLGDAERATALLQEALTTARELGMRALEARIVTRTNPATMSPPPAPLMDLDDLSPREIEVLRLMAAGKSNQEIAEALFISRNTVSTHVRNILTKTGSANRTEAAAYAMRHGLSGS